jgi:hypothetical protein
MNQFAIPQGVQCEKVCSSCSFIPKLFRHGHFSRPLHIGKPIDITYGCASPIAAFVLEDVFASGSLDGTPSPSLTLPTICAAVFHGEYVFERNSA